MMWDEDEVKPPPRRVTADAVLDPLGVAELRTYIEELQAEIARVEAAIARKGRPSRAWRNGFFRPVERKGAGGPAPPPVR